MVFLFVQLYTEAVIIECPITLCVTDLIHNRLQFLISIAVIIPFSHVKFTLFMLLDLHQLRSPIFQATVDHFATSLLMENQKPTSKLQLNPCFLPHFGHVITVLARI